MMNRLLSIVAGMPLLLSVVVLPNSVAQAHSASNAYLTLTVAPGSRQIKGQWDVALRDLHFVLGVDDDGDGRITWAELRNNQSRIAKYVYAHLNFRGDGKACSVKPVRQRVDHHADGGYAVLIFAIDCGKSLPSQLSMAYRLFFAIDPSHRGIFVINDSGNISTALLSPNNKSIKLPLAPGTRP